MLLPYNSFSSSFVPLFLGIIYPLHSLHDLPSAVLLGYAIKELHSLHSNNIYSLILTTSLVSTALSFPSAYTHALLHDNHDIRE